MVLYIILLLSNSLVGFYMISCPGLERFGSYEGKVAMLIISMEVPSVLSLRAVSLQLQSSFNKCSVLWVIRDKVTRVQGLKQRWIQGLE